MPLTNGMNERKNFYQHNDETLKIERLKSNFWDKEFAKNNEIHFPKIRISILKSSPG